MLNILILLYFCIFFVLGDIINVVFILDNVDIIKQVKFLQVFSVQLVEMLNDFNNLVSDDNIVIEDEDIVDDIQGEIDIAVEIEIECDIVDIDVEKDEGSS